MGVSGSGKSTVAHGIADTLGWDLIEGDDLHPRENIEKMAAGHPLTDEDRWPWLHRVAAAIGEHVASGRPAVVTCSALKRSYRDLLRRKGVAFVFLRGSSADIGPRLARRALHFMPPALLESQLRTLDPPGPDEHAFVVDVRASPQEEVAAVINHFRLAAQQ
jgi:gluconokinase